MATDTNSNSNTGILVIGGIVALFAIVAIVFFVTQSGNDEVQFVDTSPVGQAMDDAGDAVNDTAGSIKANIPAGDADISVDIPVE